MTNYLETVEIQHTMAVNWQNPIKKMTFLHVLYQQKFDCIDLLKQFMTNKNVNAIDKFPKSSIYCSTLFHQKANVQLLLLHCYLDFTSFHFSTPILN